jgi:hypothetical protein
MSFRAIAARASRSRETKELAYARVFCLMKRRIAFMYNFEQEHAYVHALSASAKKEYVETNVHNMLDLFFL